MIPLWDIQQEMVRDIRIAFRSHRTVLLVSPTGSGKTVMFCHMVHNHVRRGGRVLILVHRQELTQQVSDTLRQFNVEHGFIASGFPSRLCDVNVGSIFTVAKRFDGVQLCHAWSPTLIIVDEAHHAEASTWDTVLGFWPDAHVLGVTATPCRLSGEGLGGHFETMVRGPTTQQAIDRGYLVPFRAFCPTKPDMTGVRRKMGDWDRAAGLARVDRPSVTGKALDHYKQHTPDRQAVTFCWSVEHAHHVADEFSKAGIQATCIDGTIPTEWRRQIVADFKARRLKMLASCDLISEGFDCPGIEVGILLRPTQSLGLIRQQIGRTLRIAPGKAEAVILDAAGNLEQHELLDYDAARDRIVYTEPEWSLNGRTAKADKNETKGVRVCPKCWAGMPNHCRSCKNCQYVFPLQPRTVSKKKGELKEMTSDELQAKLQASLRAQEVGMANSLKALVELGAKRGYKDPEGWAQHVWQGKQAKRTQKERERMQWYEQLAQEQNR